MEPLSLLSKPAAANHRLETPGVSHDRRGDPTASARRDHVHSIDCLRGIAAFAVCCCHAIKQGPLAPAAHYGWLGVYVFFVVSGFVIPFSLWRTDYSVGSYPRFLAKRLVRLDPPYLASIAAAIALHYVSYLSPGFQGPAPNYSLKMVLMHLGYLNSFFGGIGSWIIPVYWTLGIEFQYYVLVGLLYPLLTSRRVLSQIVVFALCLAGSGFQFPLHPHVDQGSLIGHYSIAFLLGVLVFRLRARLLTARSFVPLAMALAILLSATSGAVISVTALSTALIIAFVPFNLKILAWLGSVSYSLYLFHLLVVDRVLHVGLRLVHSELSVFFVQLAAIGAAVVAAWLGARLIEEPFKRMASRIALTTRPGRGLRQPEVLSGWLRLL
jgi:peptidoglycan/LPS O-acetylase OafA/YrhL